MPYNPTTWQQRNAKDYFELVNKSTGLTDGNEYLFNYTSTEDLILSGTPFDTTNMNKIEGALNDRQIETGYSLSDIGLTDTDFTGLTQYQSALLFYNTMASFNYKELIIPVTDSVPNLKQNFAPNNSTLPYDGTLRIYRTQLLCEYSYIRRKTNTTGLTAVSERSSCQWISSFDNTEVGGAQWSEWRQSGGIRIHYTTVNPGSTVTFQDVKTASAVIIRLRPFSDDVNERGEITVHRGRNDQLISNVFGGYTGGSIYAAVRVNFSTGAVFNSSNTDSGIVIDTITCI